MDKNPKHPLKKKKVHQKMNVADHSVEMCIRDRYIGLNVGEKRRHYGV